MGDRSECASPSTPRQHIASIIERRTQDPAPILVAPLEVLHPAFVDGVGDLIAGWAGQGQNYRNNFLDGQLPETAVTEILGRSYLRNELGFLEIMTCRPLPTDFGLYQGDVLIDDFRGDSDGPHAMGRYVFTRDDGQWVSFGVDESIWLNCVEFADGWLGTVNKFSPDPVPWEPIQ